MIDVLEVAHIIKKISDQEILPRFKNLTNHDIREKGPGNLVTIADEAAEKALSAAFTSLLPESLVVGEEAVEHDKSILNALLQDDKAVWVIDPIDGTYNFSTGRSLFGVYVALVIANTVRYAWVFDVPKNEMAIAEKDCGAYLFHFDSSKKTILKRSQDIIKNPSEMYGRTGGAQSWHFKEITTKVKNLENIRSSLHDFLAFAKGDIDFILHKIITPWDHSAGVLLAEEVGGYVRVNRNELFKPSLYGKNVILVSANATTYSQLYQELNIESLMKIYDQDFPK